MLENLTVKVGQQARWHVNIGGEPAPDVIWMKGDEVVDPKTAQGIVIETKKGESTSFTIKAAKRSDCGKYTLKVKNKLGEDSCTAELTVLGIQNSLFLLHSTYS